MSASSSKVVVEVNNLKMYFPLRRGLLRLKVGDIKAVDDIDFVIYKNETLGLVGESGCGKTTVGRCILRLCNPTAGTIIFDGQDIARIPQQKLNPIRCQMGAVTRNPYGSLNPRQRAGSIVGDPLKVHHMASNSELDDRVAELFRLVGLNPDMSNRLPREFSSSQRQRIGIARALACRPSLVICDEPLSALAVSAQAEIINLLGELRENLGLTYLFITRDLAMAQYTSDRVAVMYLGRIVELTTPDELYENPLHPYTQALLSATPIPNPAAEKTRQRIVLDSEVPGPADTPPGCHFHPRCQRAIGECSQARPPLRDTGGGHYVACIRV